MVEADDNDDEEDNVSVKKKKKKKQKTVYGTGRVFPELFSNREGFRPTLRIDSKLLAEAESEDPNANKKKIAEQLRGIIATVGKPGQPGEQVRCVVSVQMLTEGWDANNVTHILGLGPLTASFCANRSWAGDYGWTIHRTGNRAADGRVCGRVRHPVLGDSI